MSYILDALVKADLERQRRRVPGLNTVQVAPLAGARSAARWPLLAAAGLALVGGGLFLASDRFGKGGGAETAAPLAAPAPTVGERPAPAAAPVAAVAAARPAARRPEERKPRPESRVYTLAELPPALQAEARKITVAGFAQASDGAERLAIINDRAWREGEEVTTGLKVERIAKDGVILNLKGYRFMRGGGQ